ncbi:MAG: hypothetical protein KDB23_32680 [Planctomycetales bacterium]|nr:hypothetical protein [Planctomycetales bacterium]
MTILVPLPGMLQMCTIMIEFHAPAPDVPELALSPLHRAALLTLRHLVETGPIGLTPNKALKRYFVTWAAEAFNWPGYTTDELYRLNKVLNEHDFPPLVVLHDLLLAAKLVRHRKGFLHITKKGIDLLEHSGSLWLVLAQHLLLAAGHDDYLDVEWVSVLNAINVVAHTGITQKQFLSRVMGADENDYNLRSLVYVHVLRPLCWLGLLQETRYKQSDRFFAKTALWSVALTFGDVTPPSVTKH